MIVNIRSHSEVMNYRFHVSRNTNEVWKNDCFFVFFSNFTSVYIFEQYTNVLKARINSFSFHNNIMIYLVCAFIDCFEKAKQGKGLYKSLRSPKLTKMLL